MRYADEEHLPLESFREPESSLTDDSPDGRPKKRKAIMLPYRSEDDAPTPEANRFDLSGTDGKGASRALRMDWEAAEPSGGTAEDAQPETMAADGASEADDDDEFAQMVSALYFSRRDRADTLAADGRVGRVIAQCRQAGVSSIHATSSSC